MKTKNTDLIMQNKAFLWIAAITGIVLSIPLLAMQFTNEVNWTLSDFIVMGILISGICSLFIFTARKIKTITNRIIAAGIFLFLFLWLWAELAVGVFTNWGS